MSGEWLVTTSLTYSAPLVETSSRKKEKEKENNTKKNKLGVFIALPSRYGWPPDPNRPSGYDKNHRHMGIWVCLKIGGSPLVYVGFHLVSLKNPKMVGFHLVSL